jgi:Ni,Fe-hydrogenase maturation factor
VKTSIARVGYPVLGDDGVGWRIAYKPQQLRLPPENAEVECLAVGGISLIKTLSGCERASLVHSIVPLMRESAL